MQLYRTPDCGRLLHRQLWYLGSSEENTYALSSASSPLKGRKDASMVGDDEIISASISTTEEQCFSGQQVLPALKLFFKEQRIAHLGPDNSICFLHSSLLPK